MQSQIEFKAPFRGMSMYPTLRDGDELLIEKFHNQPLAIGDIVFFRSHDGHEWQAHRLLQQLSVDQVLLKGDWSSNLDEPLETKAIFGIVVGKKSRHKTVVWGQRGQKIRSLFASWSLEIISSNNHFKRRFYRLAVLFLHVIESFLYLMKKPQEVIGKSQTE